MQSLPSYEALKKKFPLHSGGQIFIEKSRQTIRNILSFNDPRLLLIVGPCSIHDPDSAKEFAVRLLDLSEEVKQYFYLAMRVYCEKPRTSFGWKGFLYDPFLNGSEDLLQGIELTRRLMIELTDLHVPIATEFLDPMTARYYDDLVSWGSIGARTSSSQIHRQFASGIDIPIGFKNGVSGNIAAAVNGVVTASVPHTHMTLNETGIPSVAKTTGNPDVHVVLRGGESKPNYTSDSVMQTLNDLKRLDQPPRLIIDCSHHNSGHRKDRQPNVFASAIEQFSRGNPGIRGLMIESHLYEGKQQFPSECTNLQYGVSITDDCLDWDTTATLIRQAAFELDRKEPALSGNASRSYDKE